MSLTESEERELKQFLTKARSRHGELNVEIDASKSFEENKNAIKQAIAEKNEKKKSKILKKSTKVGDIERQALEEEEKKIRKQIMEDFNRTIDRIKSNSSPQVDRYFSPLKELIKIVAKQDLNGLIVYGEAGLGKTYVCLKTLGELGLKAGDDFSYVSGHITPIELHNHLYKFRNKISVIDDVEGILNDPKVLSILKSALWSSFDKRYVSWNSQTHFLNAPKEFEFRGKVFLLMNRIPPRNEVLNSLLSRVLTYNLKFDHRTRLEVMYEISKLFNLDLEVVDYLRSRYTPAFENFNFRTLLQLNAVRRYYDQNPPSNGVDWKTITDELIRQSTNPTANEVWRLINSEKSVAEQVREFEDITGYSRRTFFRVKTRLLEQLGAKVPSKRDTNRILEERQREAVAVVEGNK